MTRTRVAVLSLMLMLAATASFAQVGTNNGVLNPNLAGAEEMQTVSHIDATIAQAIIVGRPYLTATAFDAMLRAVSLSDEQRAEVFVTLFVPINLNTASDEAILSIPAVGRRMLHGFKEYRPYRAIEQLRREIGKYVDDNEVARLERYVVVE